jgi:hypothetical protein
MVHATGQHLSFYAGSVRILESIRARTRQQFARMRQSLHLTKFDASRHGANSSIQLRFTSKAPLVSSLRSSVSLTCVRYS